MSWIEENHPEVAGILVLICVSMYIWLCNIYVAPQVISNCASLAAQVMATMLGLILTAYLVMHGLRLGAIVESAVKTATYSEEEKELLSEALETLHWTFIMSIYIASLGTLFSVVLFFISSLSGKVDFLISENPEFVNGFCVGMLLAAITTSTLNVIGAVRTLYNIREIK